MVSEMPENKMGIVKMVGNAIKTIGNHPFKKRVLCHAVMGCIPVSVMYRVEVYTCIPLNRPAIRKTHSSEVPKIAPLREAHTNSPLPMVTDAIMAPGPTKPSILFQLGLRSVFGGFVNITSSEPVINWVLSYCDRSFW